MVRLALVAALLGLVALHARLDRFTSATRSLETAIGRTWGERAGERRA